MRAAIRTKRNTPTIPITSLRVPGFEDDDEDEYEVPHGRPPTLVVNGPIHAPRLEQHSVHLMCDRPSLGGEPLWWVSRRPPNFRLIASAAVGHENRRLPGKTQSAAFTRGLRSLYTRVIELHRAGLFAGAACFRTPRPHSR